MSFHWCLYSRLSINGSRPSLSPATSVRTNLSLQNPRLAYSNLSNIYVSVQDAQFVVRPFHLETHSVLSGKKHRHIINPFQDVLKICCWSSKLLSGYIYGEAAMNDDFPGDLWIFFGSHMQKDELRPNIEMIHLTSKRRLLFYILTITIKVFSSEH